MPNWLAMAFAALLFATADLPKFSLFQPDARSGQNSSLSGESIPVLPPFVTVENTQGSAAPNSAASKSATLTEPSKLTLIRYVSGEFAKVRRPIPGGKDGFVLYTDKPLNQEYLDRTVATHGAAINTGDKAQITKLEFREHTIIVDINGGGRPKHNWLDHIQIGMGGPTTPQSTSTATSEEQQGPPGIQPGAGGTLYLQFPKSIPDLTPDDLKKLLSPFLDFGGEHSAAVQWIDTLPADMKKAITDRHV